MKNFRQLAACIVALLLLVPLGASAHLAGNPFVSINGQFVLSNPVGGLDTAAGQDLGAKPVVVGQETHIVVDPTAFSTSAVIRFRWLWDDGSTSDGIDVHHTFKNAGSKVVHLELQTDPDPTYSDVDTVQIDVVPQAGYSVPAYKVAARQVATVGGQPKVEFSVVGAPSAKDVAWNFGDTAQDKGLKVSHIFTTDAFRLFPTVKVTDKYGVYVEKVFQVEVANGHATISDASVMAGVVSVLPAKTSRPINWRWIAGGFLILLAALNAAWVVRGRLLTAQNSQAGKGNSRNTKVKR